jgi:hypothetical protein
MLMRNKMIGFLVVLMIVISAIIGAGFQQTRLTIVEAQTTTAKLTFEISTSQNKYVQLEPIPFNFKLSNQTNEPIRWRGIPMIGQDIKFLVRGEDGQEVRWDGKGFGLIGTTFSVIQPGQEIWRKDILTSVPTLEEILSRPGRYEIRAEFRYNNGANEKQKEVIVSNPITINILEPNGVDRQAYNYIKQVIEPARYRERASGEVFQLQQNFLDNYGNSVYAKYIAIELASGYKGSGENAKAKRELCKIHNVNFYFSEQVRRNIWELEAKLHPRVLVELPENAPIPLVPHPCTGRLVNPHAL